MQVPSYIKWRASQHFPVRKAVYQDFAKQQYNMARVGHSFLLKQPGFRTGVSDDAIPADPETRPLLREAPLLSESPIANGTGAYFWVL
jgi:hypothetical protein